MIHGIPSHGGLWREVAVQLSTRARVIAPDLLGYGKSDASGGAPVDIVSQSGYLLQVLDELGVQRVTVVGHDIGGGVAQILAVQHTDRVARLGLVNSVCYDSWPIPEMKAAQKTAGVVEHLPPGLTSEGLKLFLGRGFVNQDRADRFLDDFLDRFSKGDGMKQFAEHARALDPTPTRELAPRLPELSMPVAVVWGRQDPFQKPKYAERLASDIPDAELTWIDDASHFAPADAPAQVAAALNRLLDRKPLVA
ncbi:MAG: alpha/beta hydrolase [Gemmatimonadetes bacterium]|nr:alpha/beta hydrolase [Gemmatimonadota bacterium]